MNFLLKVNKHKFSASIIIGVLSGLLVSIIGAFKFSYYTNDDYWISVLIYQGDKNILFINFFLSAFLGVMQHIFPFVNCFALFQQLSCFASIIVLNYVILNIIDRCLGIVITFVSSAFIFYFCILLLQWTHTATLTCISGIVLAYYAFQYENRKKYKVISLITAVFLLLIAFFTRVEVVKVCLVFTFLFVLGSFINGFSLKKNWVDLKNTATDFCKKNICFIMAILVFAGIGYVTNVASNNIKNGNESYYEHEQYQNACSSVSDYEILPYRGNEDFYDSVCISENDLAFWKTLYIDSNVFSKDKLQLVSEYAENHHRNQSGVAYVINWNIKSAKKNLKNYYRSLVQVQDRLGLNIPNKAFLLIVLLFFVSIIIIIVFCIKLRLKSISISFKSVCIFLPLLLLWTIFLTVVGIDNYNFLFLIVFALVIINIIRNKNSRVIYSYIFSLSSIGLYLYQRCFRMSLRVAFTFLFPTIVFMLIITYMASENEDTCQNTVLSEQKICIWKKVVASILISGTLLSAFIINWNGYYLPQTMQYDYQIRNYIDNHSDIDYYTVWGDSAIERAYVNSTILPGLQDNNVFLGGWYKSSDYFDKLINKKGGVGFITGMLNNDNKRMILRGSTETIKIFEIFCNEHYQNKGSVSAIIVDTFIISGKKRNGEIINKNYYVIKLVTD